MINSIEAFSEAVLALRLDAQWSYDRKLGRYRNEKGKFLSAKSVEKLVDERIDRLVSNLQRYTRMLVDGSITLDQWQASFREALKSAHIQTALIGHGGREGMGSAEYGRIGQRLRAEYTYLQRFASDLMAGRVSGAMALARAKLYGESVRGSFWEGTTIRQEKQGYSLMRRILDPQAQHCQDCLDYAARGLVPMGSVPLPGQRCACGARCKCSVEYKRQQFQSVSV